jgi:hypothetical protein
MMTPRIDKALTELAEAVADLSVDEDANVYYEQMSGALVWTDEFPKPRPPRPMPPRDVIGCLRFILRYRTTVIIGEPDKMLEFFWNEAQRRCPNWPGFRPERRSARYAEFYYEQDRALADQDWESPPF